MFSPDSTTGAGVVGTASTVAGGAATCSASGVQLNCNWLLSPASAGNCLWSSAVSGAQEYSTWKSLPHRGAGSPSRSTSTTYLQSARPLQLSAMSCVALPDGTPQLAP